MAARAWFDGELDSDRMVDEDLAADAAAMGLSADEAAILEGSSKPVREPFEGVWRVNEKAVRAFLCAATQLRLRGFALIGLDYAACEVAWRAYGLKVKGAVFAGFQVMEHEVVRLASGERRPL